MLTDDQVEQLADLGLEAKALGLGCRHGSGRTLSGIAGETRRRRRTSRGRVSEGCEKGEKLCSELLDALPSFIRPSQFSPSRIFLPDMGEEADGTFEKVSCATPQTTLKGARKQAPWQLENSRKSQRRPEQQHLWGGGQGGGDPDTRRSCCPAHGNLDASGNKDVVSFD